MGNAFLSALGEVGIIVLGVLIALAVDRWKESRKDQEHERHYLRGLQRDLRQDRTRLQTYLAEIQGALEATEVVLGIVRGQPPPDSEALGREMIRAGYGFEPVYALTTYTELEHGNLHLIRSEALKARIVEYYSGLVTGDRAGGRVTPQAWYDLAVEPYVKKIWPILPPGDWLRWNTVGPDDLDVGEVVSALRADPEIPRHLEGCRRVRALQLAKFKVHEDQVLGLLEALESETQRNAS